MQDNGERKLKQNCTRIPNSGRPDGVVPSNLKCFSFPAVLAQLKFNKKYSTNRKMDKFTFFSMSMDLDGASRVFNALRHDIQLVLLTPSRHDSH